jgi:ferritin
MDEALLQAFNDQIQLEFASAYTYLQMAAWCETNDLAGFATWMRAQWAEESQHALKFVDFVLDRDGEVRLQPIEAPPATFRSPLDLIQRAHQHEQRVTTAIGALYAQASQAHDYTSLPLLQWFLNEQIEEEAAVRQIEAELRMAGDSAVALLLLDRELPARRRAGEGA